ncbi:hypothetical protein K1719_034498 [Acacia pycnantha]|nr:hypothetical protein K1719_034498 [Acacia pycnantha]
MEAWCLDNAIMIGGHVGEVMLAEDPLYNGRSERLMSVFIPAEPRFGPWLTTNACRVWEEVLTVVRPDWEEAAYFKKKKDEAELRKKIELKQRADKEADVEDGDLFSIKVRNSSGEERRRDPIKSKVEEESEVRVCEAMNESYRYRRKNYPKPLADEVKKRKEEVLKDACGSGERSEGNRAGHKEAFKDKPLKPPESVLMQPLGGQEMNSLAMVLYDGEALNEVTGGLKNLGLKRTAEAELMPLTFKRRKLTKKEQGSPKSAISCYADSLKKGKARMRKTAKRKLRDEKENMLEEVLCPDDTMEDSLDADPLGTTFVFKAKGGRRKRNAIEARITMPRWLILYSCESKSPKSFKFEANWTQHEGFLQIVEQGWNDVVGIVDDRILDLIRRLDACRKKLVEWSRREFPNFRKVVEHLRKNLASCYEGTLTEAKLLEVKGQLGRLKMQDKEESYWWQRSRISWLTCGDRNTKFFHTSVIQRRQRNKILR